MPDHVVELLDVSEGMTVVDLGAGGGYFACRLSRDAGSRGKVIATEVNPRAIRMLRKRVKREQLANVAVVRAPANEVGVAARSADRILVVNVWHHLPNRKRYAARLARTLAPGGKLVIVDFPRVGRDPHGIAPERVLAELAAGGLEGALVAEELRNQYVIVASPRG